MANPSSFLTHEAYLEYHRNYRKKNEKKLKAYWRKYRKKYRSRNGTKKDQARDKVKWAISKGKLIKKNCEVCGIENTEAHHPDYSKPLEVKWLCRKHHHDLHHPD